MRSNHGTSMQPDKIPEGYVWLGQVGRPHGVKGAFFLKSVDQRQDWPGYRQIMIQTPQTPIKLNIEKAYQSGGKLVLQPIEWKTREDCEFSYNAHLFVSRELIQTSAEEYLVGEIVGCEVRVEGRAGVFGIVVAVHNFGAQETLEIQRAETQGTILFPFLEQFVLSVDQKTRTILVQDEPAFLDER